VIKAEWGTKRSCPKCGTRFYDLGKDEPVECIGCGFSWTPEPILKSKQSLPFETEKAEGKPGKTEGEDALEGDDLDDIDADEGEPADDAEVDIGSDDTDLAEVVVEDKEEDN
jgi:uncharacterized protein (TIGR02300 family)